MSIDNKLQRILSDHIEQMSKDLEKVSNGEDHFVFKVYERNLLINICEKASELFKKEPIILNLKGDCVVVGDLHGHIIDLYRIFTIFDLPPKTTYLFLGDIVDRGGFSIETITLLFVLKLLYPSNIYLIRGNHEFNMASEKEKDNESLNNKYINSFKDQIAQVYGFGIQKRHSFTSAQTKKSLLSQKNQQIPSNDSTENEVPLNRPTIHSLSDNPHSTASNSINISKIPNLTKRPSISLSNSHMNTNNYNTENNSSGSEMNKPKPKLYPANITSSSNGYSERLYICFCSAFSYIPLAAMFGTSIICLHGGIGGNFTNIQNDIQNLERPILNYDNNIIENILWSDPMPPEKESDFKNIKFMTSGRGRGCIFGKASFDVFMKTNQLSLLIRAHEVVEQGIRIQFNNRLITVFSASSYIDVYKNNSGVLKISEDNKVTTYSFPPFKFLPRESAVFISNNNGNNQVPLPISVGRQATYTSTTIKSFNSNFNQMAKYGLDNEGQNSSDLEYNTSYSVDSFYNVNSNSIGKPGGNRASSSSCLTKIVSKTLLSNNRKINIPTPKLIGSLDQKQSNSTRRRIKFTPIDEKKSLASAIPAQTFS